MFLVDSSQFSVDDIKRIEQKYDAKYICETCIRNKTGGWANRPVAVFYQPDTDKVPDGGTQWFGMFVQEGNLYICNAVSALEPFRGVKTKHDDVLFSRWRHDYRADPHNEVWVDGGRDYLRWGGEGEVVRIAIDKDHLEIIE